MKISKLKSIIPLMLVVVTLVCQPAIWAGEHPWDGDNSPAGGQHPGGSNGGGGEDSTSILRPMTKLVSPQGGTGINFQFYLDGLFFRFATTVYSHLVVKDVKRSGMNEKQAVSSTVVPGDVKQTKCIGSSR